MFVNIQVSTLQDLRSLYPAAKGRAQQKQLALGIFENQDAVAYFVPHLSESALAPSNSYA